MLRITGMSKVVYNKIWFADTLHKRYWSSIAIVVVQFDIIYLV